MDDPFLMRGVERGGNLARDRERLGNRQSPARQTIGERRSFDELENERRDAIFQSEDRADVRVVQRCSRASRAKRDRRSGSEVKCSGRILIATLRPSLLSRAR